MTHSSRVLTAGAFLSMFFLGVAGALIGAAARNINLSPFQIGVMLAVQNLGFGLAVLVAGGLSDTADKPRILLVGSLILAISFFGFYASDRFWLNLVLIFFIGAGVGTYEGVTDALLLDLHLVRRGLFINVNHFFVTLGSILITTYLIFLQMNWRSAVVQSAVLVLLLALLYAVVKQPRQGVQTTAAALPWRSLLSERLIVAFAVAAMLIIGVEVGLTGILTTYLMDLGTFTQTTSKLGLVTFLGGIAAGRLAIGSLSREGQIARLMLTLLGLTTLLFAVIAVVPLGQGIYLGVFLAGFAMSGLFPLMITVVGNRYPARAGTAIGVLKIAIPIGGIIIPGLMSLATRVTSLQTALLIFPVALLVAWIVVWAAVRQDSEPAHAP